MPTEFKMPQLGESVVEGTIARWLKQKGDPVDQYEPLLEVETDKVTSEVPAPVGGVVVEIVVPEGQTVPTGTLLCLIGQADEAPAQEKPPAPTAKAESPEAGPTAEASSSKRNGPHITPIVARLAAEHGIDLSQVTGTGRGGRVTKKDMLAFIERREAEAAPEPPPEPAQVPAPADATNEIVPLSGMRRAIAEHMLRSRRTSAHVTTLMEADCSRIWAYRERHQAEFQRQEGAKLTFTPFFMAASASALRAVPIVNSRFNEDGIELLDEINIGLAVALEEGLIVPVVKQADRLNLTGLQRAVTDLAERARRGQLTPDEVQGGTFTISNHGTGGSLLATPIINQPQAAILGVGAIEKRVVVVSQEGTDSIAIKPMCYLSLSFDHRLLDGATADRFLVIVKREIETWT